RHLTTIFSLIPPPPPHSTLFPYTTLFRSVHHQKGDLGLQPKVEHANDVGMHQAADMACFGKKVGQGGIVHLSAQDFESDRGVQIDRKSTRLNSSHVSISYAVFCLKKKKKK